MLSNVVVIKEPADIPAHLDRDLAEHYLNTSYWTELIRIDEQGANLRIGQPHPETVAIQLEEFGISSYAFITAWNPGSQPLDQWHNRWRNINLELELHPVSRLLRRGMGIGVSEDWQSEESFWALDVPVKQAVDIAKQFGQQAIVVWQQGGVPELWWI